MVVAEVFSPRTTSSRRMTFAGLKKCRPMTSSGREVTEAMASTSRPEVFDAIMAPGLHTFSNSSKTFFFTSRFS